MDDLAIGRLHNDVRQRIIVHVNGDLPGDFLGDLPGLGLAR